MEKMVDLIYVIIMGMVMIAVVLSRSESVGLTMIVVFLVFLLLMIVVRNIIIESRYLTRAQSVLGTK